MSAETNLRDRVTVFRNMSHMGRHISLGVRTERGTSIVALDVREAKQVAALLMSLARQERRKAKR